MSVSVTDSGGTIKIDDGNSILYPQKNKISVGTILDPVNGSSVFIRYDEDHYVQYPAAQFSAPSGTASAIAAAIAAFLDSGAGNVSGSGTTNYITKWTASTTIGNSLVYDNGVSVLMGGTTGIASAQLALTSTTQGFLTPRMTTAQKNAIGSPATGLLVYDTNLATFSFYNGAAWGPIGTSYTFSTGLTNSANTITSNLSTGISGGQSAYGGTAASENLTLYSTSHATKGKILFGTSAYDEANNRLGIGTASPSATAHIKGLSATSATDALLIQNSASALMLQVSDDIGVGIGVDPGGQQTRLYIKGENNASTHFGISVESSAGTRLFAVTNNGIFTINGVANFVQLNGNGSNQLMFQTQAGVENWTFALFNEILYLTDKTANSIRFEQGAKLGVNCTPTAQFEITEKIKTSGTPSAMILTSGGHTTLTASTEAIGTKFNFSAGKQWATGAITTQREFLIQAPTYSFVGASTITNAATLAISAAPIAGTNATITNPYALWIQSGCIGLVNAGAPSASVADTVQIFAADISAGNASLALRTETAVVTEAVVSDRTLSITVNGTVYKVCLKA